MRRLALLALLAAAPAQAQDRPEWAGLWEGRVGTFPVRMCLDGAAQVDASGRGSYYYLSRLEPIQLEELGGEYIEWVERAPGSDAEAKWEFDFLSATVARGTWRQGRRSWPSR
jgi:hypothetical protein